MSFSIMLITPLLSFSAQDNIVTGIVKNVRIVDWSNVDSRPNETFITLKSGEVFRFPSRKAVGIGQRFKVDIHIPVKSKKRNDGSITACAAQIIAIPVHVDGKEILHPVDNKVWVMPLQEEGCNHINKQSNKTSMDASVNPQ